MSVELEVVQWTISVSGPVAVQTVTLERAVAASVTVVGVQGPTGASGASVPPLAFSFGDVSPAIVYTVTGPSLFKRLTVRIRTPFNGISPSISVGITGQPELFFPAAYNLPSAAGDYEVSVDRDLLAGDEIRLFMSPGFGATTGSGFIIPEIFAK